MEYSIRELAELAGVSARTLRYYDQIGLLKPLYVNDAGYRYYGGKEVENLQQILFYRERGFDLKRIRKILYQDDFDIMEALKEHLAELEAQKKHMDALIRTVECTIASLKGEFEMSDTEKFEAFKEQLVKENEQLYGAEAREKYGDEAVETSQRKILNMAQEDYERFQNLEAEIVKRLEEYVADGIKPESEAGKQVVMLHKEWLGMTWKTYSEEAHKGIATMYISDERFKAYYDKNVSGCAEFLEAAVRYWVDRV